MTKNLNHSWDGKEVAQLLNMLLNPKASDPGTDYRNIPWYNTAESTLKYRTNTGDLKVIATLDDIAGGGLTNPVELLEVRKAGLVTPVSNIDDIDDNALIEIKDQVNRTLGQYSGGLLFSATSGGRFFAIANNSTKDSAHTGNSIADYSMTEFHTLRGLNNGEVALQMGQKQTGSRTGNTNTYIESLVNFYMIVGEVFQRLTTIQDPDATSNPTTPDASNQPRLQLKPQEGVGMDAGEYTPALTFKDAFTGNLAHIVCEATTDHSEVGTSTINNSMLRLIHAVTLLTKSACQWAAILTVVYQR